MIKQYEFSTLQGMSTEITPKTHANTSDIHKHHSYTPTRPPPLDTIKISPDNKRSQHMPTDTSWCQQALSAILKQHLGGSGDVGECLLVSVCFCWRQLEHEWCLEGVLWVLDCIWLVSLYVCSVWMCLRGYLGAHPLQSGEFTPFWLSHERQDFLHLAILRHQNIKMSTYILNKNGWVLPFFIFLVPVREKL